MRLFGWFGGSSSEPQQDEAEAYEEDLPFNNELSELRGDLDVSDDEDRLEVLRAIDALYRN